jgi:hypothetical protein
MTIEDVFNAILQDILQDFVDRRLDSAELIRGYIGPSVVALRRKYCADNGVSTVDFDLAMKELESQKAIGTGPMDLHDNPPGSPVVRIGFYSKREYTYLTEKGYRLARKKPVSQRGPVNTNFHISGGTFYNPRINHSADYSTNTVNVATPVVFNDLRRVIREHVREDVDRDRLITEIEAMQSSHGQPNFLKKYQDFMTAAANHMTVIGPFLPALAALLHP